MSIIKWYISTCDKFQRYQSSWWQTHTSVTSVCLQILQARPFSRCKYFDSVSDLNSNNSVKDLNSTSVSGVCLQILQVRPFSCWETFGSVNDLNCKHTPAYPVCKYFNSVNNLKASTHQHILCALAYPAGRALLPYAHWSESEAPPRWT